MRITIINTERSEKRYTRVELDEFVAQLKDGTYRQENTTRDTRKEVCFAAEWLKLNGELKAKNDNHLVLLSLENLRDLATVREYKELANRQLYTLLCFIGDDGHSLHIVCRYTGLLLNAYRKLHYIYSTQLGTQGLTMSRRSLPAARSAMTHSPITAPRHSSLPRRRNLRRSPNTVSHRKTSATTTTPRKSLV